MICIGDVGYKTLFILLSFRILVGFLLPASHGNSCSGAIFFICVFVTGDDGEIANYIVTPEPNDYHETSTIG